MLGVWWFKQHPGFSGVCNLGPNGASHFTRWRLWSRGGERSRSPGTIAPVGQLECPSSLAPSEVCVENILEL